MKKKKSKCKHLNKVYDNNSYSLTSTFGGTYTNWICKDCGFEGQECTVPVANEYELTRQKFMIMRLEEMK
jgi:hypothetical protein